jgi:hypothetical protein
MTPSGPLTFFVAGRRALVGPCSLSSNASPRCLEFRFYNRRCASRAPVENITFGDRLPSAVGKPASVRLPDRHRTKAFPPTEGDAGPPCGHPASNGRALDGAPPASGRSTLTFMLFRRGVRGRASLLYRLAAAPSDRDPLTSLAAAGVRDAEATLSQSREPVPTRARQCTRSFRARDAFHRRRPRERSCESCAWSAASLANEDSHRTFSSVFENID